jgi:hypothetical protein
MRSGLDGREPDPQGSMEEEEERLAAAVELLAEMQLTSDQLRVGLRALQPGFGREFEAPPGDAKGDAAATKAGGGAAAKAKAEATVRETAREFAQRLRERAAAELPLLPFERCALGRGERGGTWGARPDAALRPAGLLAQAACWSSAPHPCARLPPPRPRHFCHRSEAAAQVALDVRNSRFNRRLQQVLEDVSSINGSSSSSSLTSLGSLGGGSGGGAGSEGGSVGGGRGSGGGGLGGVGAAAERFTKVRRAGGGGRGLRSWQGPAAAACAPVPTLSTHP